MAKALKYAAGAIALYLVVDHFSGASSVTGSLANGGSSLVRAFQGR